MLVCFSKVTCNSENIEFMERLLPLALKQLCFLE